MFPTPELIAALSASVAELHTTAQAEDGLPSEQALTHARRKLLEHLPSKGEGLEATIKHLREDIAPGFSSSSRSSNYYGFVTGGTTPAAGLADNLVTFYDQNVGVHLPKETVATNLEDRALSLLCELLKLDPVSWPHRTFTTGATASNVLGLACGREYVISEAAAVRSDSSTSVGEIGIFAAMHRVGIDQIQILSTVPHSSLIKAAGILGLGRASVRSVGLEASPHRFNMPLLKKLLEQSGSASIVVISASEINTGWYATAGFQEMKEIRQLCDVYGAWLHVDGGEYFPMFLECHLTYYLRYQYVYFVYTRSLLACANM